MTGRFIQKETAASRPLAAAPTGDSPVSYPNFPAFPQPLRGGRTFLSPNSLAQLVRARYSGRCSWRNGRYGVQDCGRRQTETAPQGAVVIVRR